MYSNGAKTDEVALGFMEPLEDATRQLPLHPKKPCTLKVARTTKRRNPFTNWQAGFDMQIKAILAEKASSPSAAASIQGNMRSSPEELNAVFAGSPQKLSFQAATQEMHPVTEFEPSSVDGDGNISLICSEMTDPNLPTAKIDREMTPGESDGKIADQGSIEALVDDLIRYAPADVQAAIAAANKWWEELVSKQVASKQVPTDLITTTLGITDVLEGREAPSSVQREAVSMPARVSQKNSGAQRRGGIYESSASPDDT